MLLIYRSIKMTTELYFMTVFSLQRRASNHLQRQDNCEPRHIALTLCSMFTVF